MSERRASSGAAPVRVSRIAHHSLKSARAEERPILARACGDEPWLFDAVPLLRRCELDRGPGLAGGARERLTMKWLLIPE